MGKHTINRRSDVVTRVEGGETLVLDLQSNTAHCLSGDLAAVWNAADRSVAAVAAATGLADDAVEDAIGTLVELGLVGAGLSRRSLVTRGAVAGGALVAAGAISMPLPASAATLSNDGFEVTGVCTGNFVKLHIEPVGSKGVLDPLVPYQATLVYETWDGTSVSYKTVTFDVTTNGAKIQSGNGTGLGTDAAATVVVSPGGSNGHVDVTATFPFTGIYSLPPNLWGPPTPTPGGFGAGALNGSGSGNVYLQFVRAGGTNWSGYFNVTGCVVFAPGSHPPIAWPPPTS